MIEVFPRNLKRNLISLFHLLVVLGIESPGPFHHFYFDTGSLTKVSLNSFCSPGRHMTCDPPASAP